MANELQFHGNEGYPISFTLSLANPAAAASTAMTQPQGNTGFVVPAGYAFHPMVLSLASNADLTAGTATAKVTDNGTVISGGPEPALSDTVQQAAAVARPQVAPIAAGHTVGIKLVTDAGYLPVTADHDAVLSGLLLPV